MYSISKNQITSQNVLNIPYEKVVFFLVFFLHGMVTNIGLNQESQCNFTHYKLVHMEQPA